MRYAGGAPVLALALAACASSQTPVPVVGARADVAALAGRWDGSYSSSTTGRSGSISFTLTARGDSAYGDVVMIPVGWNRPIKAWNDPQQPGQTPPAPAAPEILTINFVRVQGDRVSGTLAPYADPETGMKLFTTFDGRIASDTIAGTFTTRPGPAPTTQSGRWSVTRRRP